MNGVRSDTALKRPVLKCAQCGATFTRQWKLKEHGTVHTGERPCQCAVAGCGRRFSRKSHLKRHMLQHQGMKNFKCKFSTCTKAFSNAVRLKRHVRYEHGDKNKFFKCNQAKCTMTFKKRRLFKLHLQKHEVAAKFKCSKDGCTATFDSHVACKAHQKTHAGYRCPHANCQVVENTWGKLQKHMAKHPATFTCQVCKKVLKKADALRKHKRIHASHKPVLVCPWDMCQAYFSTTFNLQHHIRKVHLQLLKYKCPFSECPRQFAMRESMSRHLLRHNPSSTTLNKRKRPKKTWQKRLNGHKLPHVEENLRRLFDLRMWVSRRTKVETNLSGLFNERKIPHYVDPEVNLRNLFGMKRPKAPKVEPVK